MVKTLNYFVCICVFIILFIPYSDTAANEYSHQHDLDGFSLEDTGTMRIYEYAVNCFSKECLKTEYTAYKLLKDKPLNCDVNYIAVPWSVLINTGQLRKVPDIKVDGGFTICQHILFEKIIPLLKDMGINTLFTPHATKEKKYSGITVLPFPHLAINISSPAPKKDLWYSFIGFDTHRTRSIIFNMPHPDNVVVKRRNRWHFCGNLKKRARESREYREVLARSRFSLCPRGTGPGTPRFWESLSAGAIPICISDSLALPEEIDWDSCIIYVAESDVDKIGDILLNVTPEQEEIMRKNCLSCFRQFSGKNFISIIRSYYETAKSNSNNKHKDL